MHTFTSAWQPVAPSHRLRRGHNIVAGFIKGEELALWRSLQGEVQAWENRCPHRGTRLTLGRILEGRLSCAYHGWEFEASDGRCAAIPAHPAGPVPRKLCVKTYAAAEAGGMVWASESGADTKPSGVTEARFFCRSLGLRASASEVAQALAGAGFEWAAPAVWQGRLARKAAVVYLNEANDRLAFAHAWLDEQPQPAELAAVMAALQGLRRTIDTAVTTAGSTP